MIHFQHRTKTVQFAQYMRGRIFHLFQKWAPTLQFACLRWCFQCHSRFVQSAVCMTLLL